MFRLELVGVLLFSCTQILTEHRNLHGPYHQPGHQRQQQQQQQNWDEDIMFKEIRVKQGRLRGRVVQPDTNPRLPLVDIFLGESQNRTKSLRSCKKKRIKWKLKEK